MRERFALDIDTACFVATVIGRNPKTYDALNRLIKGLPPPDLSIRHRLLSEVSILSEFYSRQALSSMMQDDLTFGPVIAAGWPDITEYADRRASDPPLDLNRWFDEYVSSHDNDENLLDYDWYDAGIIMKFYCAISQIAVIGDIQAEFDEVILMRSKGVRRESLAVPPETKLCAKNIVQAMKSKRPGQLGTLGFLDRIYAQEGLNRASLLQGIRTSRRDLDDVSTAFAMADEYALRLQDPLFTRLFQITLHIKGLLRAYNQCRTDFWRCMKLQVGLTEAKAMATKESLRADEAEAKVCLLETELEFQRINRARMQAELDKAEEERLAELQLPELLMAAEAQEQDYSEESQEIDVDQLNAVKAVFIGGHDSIREKLATLLPDWKFYGDEIVAGPVRTASWVVFHPAGMSHKSFYKLLSLLPDRNRLRFVNSNNIRLLLNQMQSATTQ